MIADNAWIIVGLALLGCGGTDAGSAEGTSNAGGTILTLDHEPMTLDQPATAHVTLFGYDHNLADASATAVARYTLEVEALPVDLELDIPEDPHTLIDQEAGPVGPDKARFYFHIAVDVDLDGQLCEEDIIQDFDRSEFTSFATKPPEEHKVFVKRLGAACRPIE